MQLCIIGALWCLVSGSASSMWGPSAWGSFTSWLCGVLLRVPQSMIPLTAGIWAVWGFRLLWVVLLSTSSPFRLFCFLELPASPDLSFNP